MVTSPGHPGRCLVPCAGPIDKPQLRRVSIRDIEPNPSANPSNLTVKDVREDLMFM